MKQPKYTFAFGEPACVRETLETVYSPKKLPTNLSNLSYMMDDGYLSLINEIRVYLKQTTGNTYTHIIITPGTTPGVSICIRVLASIYGFKSVSTEKHTFMYYPEIIARNGLIRTIVSGNNDNMRSIGISDSPSNPFGTYRNVASHQFNIWDSVYHCETYGIGKEFPVPRHIVNCGSFSKSFGLTGLRIGYIATNDTFLYDKLSNEVKYQYCTVSHMDQLIAYNLLQNVDHVSFFKKAANSINNNRETFQKVEKFFTTEVNPKGMFYTAGCDKSTLKLLSKIDVEYIKLEDNLIRFNLAQNNQLTSSLIKDILKVDRRK